VEDVSYLLPTLQAEKLQMGLPIGRGAAPCGLLESFGEMELRTKLQFL